MEQIIELNNLGVRCIDANKFKEAVHHLGCALELAQSQFYTNPLLSHPSTHHHNTPPQSPRTPSSRQDTTSTIMSVGDDNDPILKYDEGQPFHYSSATKYQHPFKLFPDILKDPNTPSSLASSPNLTCSTPTPKIAEAHAQRLIELSAIVIFNLALCYDMLAASCPPTMTTKQNLWTGKAISLYEKVVEIALQARMDSDVDDGSTNPTTRALRPGSSEMVWRAQNDMVVMAAINNLVQLDQEPSLSRKEGYLTLMMGVLHQVQLTEYGNEEIQFLVTSQARTFASNTVLASSSHYATIFWSLLAVSAPAA